MTQPAKVQEPSMEEILASIRRIIADDEAKPDETKPADIKAVEAAPKPAAVVSAPVAKPAPKAPEPAPEPAASNNQDDIDAMLASFDAVTPEPEPQAAPPADDVFELTDEMIAEDPEPAFRRVEPADDLEFAEAVAASTQTPRFDAPSYDPPPREQPAMTASMMSQSTASAVESAFNSLANAVLSNNARTLEDLVKEMLRPMLKTWLDD
ncbi:MAG: DUF2497 domain-containing protein, partial [Bradyrhizobiaceae bacterium]